jgi:hypothetical protein
VVTLASDRSPHIELIGRLQSLQALLVKLRGDKEREAEFEDAITTFSETVKELKSVYIHQVHVVEALRRLEGLRNVIRLTNLTVIYGFVDDAIEVIERYGKTSK